MRDRDRKKDGCTTCARYTKSILKFLLSHIGLVSLVVGYTIIGAVTFEKLESDHELMIKKNITSIRLAVTDDLWAISEDFDYFEEVKWAKEARKHLKEFEQDLIRAMKNEGWDGTEGDDVRQWTFAGALFYSIILITTIGYGHIAPKTSLGKIVTIFYAIPGVPLMMLCLANIGDGMAHSFRFLYWKVCCYACTKKPKKKRRKARSRSSRMYNDSVDPNGGYLGPRSDSRMMRGGAGDDGRGNGRSSRGAGPGGPGGGGAGIGGFNDQPGAKRGSENSNRSGDHLEIPNSDDVHEDSRGNVLFNKYALDKDGGFPDDSPSVNQMQRGRSPNPNADRGNEFKPARDRSRDRMREPEILVTRPQKAGVSPTGRSTRSSPANVYPESPSMGPPRDSGYYSRHVPPPDSRNSRLSRLEEDYYDEEYYYEDDDDDDDDENEEANQRPVPIWLGVMLVIVYIFAGAFLFSNWEGWDFLDSVYFCFITLTTIGFGDLVPAQEKKANAELSIALCSIYLLFGIALLAMSFNLVQEEVISNVKRVAKRLGILKDDEDEEED